jgi:serine/threonine protein kinase
VVLLLGVTTPPQPFCIVTEFCANGSLLQYLLKHSDVTPAMELSILTGIAKGMLHLHSENIIHVRRLLMRSHD